MREGAREPVENEKDALWISLGEVLVILHARSVCLDSPS